ncbi:3-hydroxyacyl-CoA dehydrogenase family protein [Aeromicrobium ginsengisoli]|uniref:3-hydroxyacyl-CoA dehydrogenase family protein n=1 Tax=Aeromicrobium ginsengisoli TaxID=363867 RepID=A0A5M4FCN5_9ACTN|nr:3-hydroxyacyl-CoA dehydrogenase family protein [Aeromicrobium ginsengisoli]
MNTSPLRVTVVGSGYMGKGIAHTLARGGAVVTLADREPDIAAAALEAMIEDVRVAEDRGLVPAGSVDQVRAGSTAGASIEAAVAGADLVVEAVFEDIAVKHAVLKVIEEATGDDTVITTNTSAIPVSDLAAVLRRPQRFFGVHWFNPAPYLPAIEVILGSESDESLLAPVTELLVASGKAPVVVADTPGFICNRLQFALFKEAALMVEEGTATAERIDGVVRSSFGFRLPFFGPFAIADMAGLDVYANSYTTLEAQLGPRFTCPPSLRSRVDTGDLGIKTGGGYLGLTAEESAAMTERRDRSYVALATLRDSLESSDD